MSLYFMKNNLKDIYLNFFIFFIKFKYFIAVIISLNQQNNSHFKDLKMNLKKYRLIYYLLYQ